MSVILDSQIDDLLHQAESRLQTEPPQVTKSQAKPEPEQMFRARGPVAAEQRPIRVRNVLNRSERGEKSVDTAGPQWFSLPKTKATPEFKRDWQLLRMRGLLDPKNQKKALRSTAPEYSQVGEIISGPADFYSGRLTRKERKSTLAGEIMSGLEVGKLRSKFDGIQRNKASGKKQFYRKLVSQRRRGRG